MCITAMCCFAGKKEIIAFKEKTGMCYEWQTIRNKVVNEKMAWKKRADKRLLNLHFGNIASILLASLVVPQSVFE